MGKKKSAHTKLNSTDRIQPPLKKLTPPPYVPAKLLFNEKNKKSIGMTATECNPILSWCRGGFIVNTVKGPYTVQLFVGFPRLRAVLSGICQCNGATQSPFSRSLRFTNEQV